MTNHTASVTVSAEVPGPPQAAFDAWTEPAKLERWFCGGKTSEVEAWTCVRVDGCYLIVMKGEREWPHAGAYLEVERGRRLRFTWYTPSTDFQRSEVSVEFAAAGSGTRVTIVHQGLPEAERESHHRGWRELLDQLAALQAGATGNGR